MLGIDLPPGGGERLPLHPWFGLVSFVLSSTYPSLIKQLLFTFFILTPKFSCFILPLLCPAEGEGERAAVWCFAAHRG